VKPPRHPLYLARDTYRRRRAMDAVRLLPFLGLFLMLLPLLWSDSAGPGESTAREGLFLFAAWALLILAAAVLSRWLSDGGDEFSGPTDGAAPPPGAPRPGPDRAGRAAGPPAARRPG
jgi:hypothetical protein